jgi:site-specific DNA-methyltransferase (adenine-specific)
MTNRLYYGDNLDVMRDREAFPNASVDLIYLDPPFNSNANYNILFKAPSGKAADSQIEAFEDTWHWNEKAEAAFDAVMHSGHTDLAELLRSMRTFLHDNDMMAYLTMMAVRLIELHRVLKPTGSIYLHCDPTASHYLKLLLDGVFGPINFRTEIIWKRTFAHGNVGRTYGDVTDTIFFYTKTDKYLWNQPFKQVIGDKLAKKYPKADPDGRRWQSVTLRNPGLRPNLYYAYTAANGLTYQPHPNGWSCNLERMERYDRENRLHFPTSESGALRLKMYEDESPGERLQSLWDDIPPISSQAQERLGYPTQKPLALLSRIISTSSSEGDIIFDPFCGCGTAVHAAEKLGRRWAGIDITHLAITLIEKRMRDAFPKSEFSVEGTPKDLESALDLAARDKYQFQWWAISKVDAVPFGGKKKGADGGIDGVIYFKDYNPTTEKMDTHRALVSVKGGQTKGVAMVEQLIATIERENAEIGVLLMAALPTREMERRAAAAGFYRDGVDEPFPRLQIITIAELFNGKKPRIPNVDRSHLRSAKTEMSHQEALKL